MMKKIVKIAITVMLMLTALAVSAAAVPDANPTVRVGLYYNTSALVSANLQNKVGQGYRLGFFDSRGDFISLWTISDIKITMANDQNLYYKDSKFYASGAPEGSRLLGAYHVQFNTQYATAQLAQTALSQISAKGVPCFVSYSNGAYYIRSGSYDSSAAAAAAALQYVNIGPATAVGAGHTCVTVYNTETGAILFEFEGGVNVPLAVYPSLGEVSEPLTWFKGYQYHGAFEYSRNNGNISVINRVSMQQYVKGVVPYEMSPSWPVEALKAQALCARTYAYSNFGKHGSSFDICASTHCQVYSGANSASENSNRAVDETLGQYILYDGEPINAVFHSSDGGATEDAENVWGYPTPYLRGVYDSYEDLDSATNGRWKYEYTPEQLQSVLNAKGYEIGLIADAFVEEFTKMGNVRKVTFIDVNGKKLSFEKEKARTIINSSSLKKYTHSQRYNITRAGAVNAGNTAASSGGASSLFVNDGSTVLNPASDSISVIRGSGAIGMLPKTDAYVQTATGKEHIVFNSVQTAPQTQPVQTGNFIFSGTGWGHNVGMSQNGALGMAKQGFTAQQIIHFYYTDVTITGE